MLPIIGGRHELASSSSSSSSSTCSSAASIDGEGAAMKHKPSPQHLASQAEIILDEVGAEYEAGVSSHCTSSLDAHSDSLRWEIATVRVDTSTRSIGAAAITTTTTTTATTTTTTPTRSGGLPYCGISDGGGNQSMAPCSRDAIASSLLLLLREEAGAVSDWREAAEQADPRHRTDGETSNSDDGIARARPTTLSATRQAAEGSPHGPQMSGNESAEIPHRSSTRLPYSEHHGSSHEDEGDPEKPVRNGVSGAGSSEEKRPSSSHTSPPQPDDGAQMEAQSETTTTTTAGSGIDRLIERESPPPSTVSCIIEMFTYEDQQPTLIHSSSRSDSAHFASEDDESSTQQAENGMKKLLETSVLAEEIVRDEGQDGLKLKVDAESAGLNRVSLQATSVVLHPVGLLHPPHHHHQQHPHVHHRRHPTILRSALKKTSDRKHRRRVTFSDTMTVFVDGCLEAQIVALHSPEFNIAEACYMYEPPPEYQDCLPFEPPPDYRDPDVTQESSAETNLQKLETLSQPDVIREAQSHRDDGAVPGAVLVPSASRSHHHTETDTDQIAAHDSPPAYIQFTIVPKEQQEQDNDEEEKDVSKDNDKDSKPSLSESQDGRDIAIITMDEIARDLDYIDDDEDTEDEEGAPLEEASATEDEETNESLDVNSVTIIPAEERARRIDSIESDIRELQEQLFGDDPSTKDFYATPIFVSSLDELEEGLFGDNLESIMEDGGNTNIRDNSGTDSDQFTPSASPLGSLSDSDSSVSSQDTMIMMTSEESERNEAHIKESLVRYESLRRQILGDSGGSNTDISLYDDSESATDVLDNVTEELLNDLKESAMNENSAVPADGEDNVEEDVDNHVSRTNSQIRRTLERNAMRRNLQTNQSASEMVKRKNQSDSLTRARGSSPMMFRDDSLEEKLRWLTTMEEDESGGADTPPQKESQADVPTNSEVQEKCAVDNRTPLSIISDSRTHSILAPVPIHPVRHSLSTSHGQHNRQQYVQHQSGHDPRRVITRMLVSSSARGSSASLSEGINKVPTTHGVMVQSLVIPSNLREWKISRTLENNSSHSQESGGGVTLQLRRNDEVDGTSGGSYRAHIVHHPQHPHPVATRRADNGQETEALDELENFVQRDIERIERIRKRYSLTEDEDDPTFGFARRPSVRGIKPKFGSTTEILKQMQSQMQPPAMSTPQGNSDTWPFREPVEGRFLRHQGPASSSSILDGLVPTKIRFKAEKRHLLRETRYASVSDLVPHLRSGRENAPAVYLQLYSNPAQLHHQQQTILVPHSQQQHVTNMKSLGHGAVQYGSQRQLVRDERGAPEGASSSPQVSSDSLYQALPAHSNPTDDDSKKEGVIYFAMNV